MDIYNEYHLFESKIDSEDIETLVAVCQYMKIPVKMIYSSSFMYYKYYYLLENSQKPILMSACIGLACKLLDNVINYKDIISCVKKKVSFAEDIVEAVLNMELEILVITRFDISLSDLYAYTQVVCLKYCLKKSICRKAWVLLNDSMHLPLIIFFNSKILVNSIVVLACKLENEEIDLKHEIFIIERMIMLYENRSK